MSDERSINDVAPVTTGQPKVTRATARTVGAAETAVAVGPGDAVTTDVFTLKQGGANTVQARHVEVRQGGIARAEARDIKVAQGGIAIARGEHISVEMGGVGLALAGEAELNQAFVRNLVARDVRVEQGAAGAVLAGRATFADRGIVGVLIAPRVDGDVRTLIDWRGMLAFGAAAGLVAGLLRVRR